MISSQKEDYSTLLVLKNGTIFDQKFLFLNGFTNKKLSADQSDLDGV